MLHGKRIVVGVTGGIAAYKAPDIVHRLIKQGAEVDVVLTQGALQFVHPRTFSALTGRAVYTDMFDCTDSSIRHIELANCDMVLIAPATRNTVAKIASGMCDDLLSATVAATLAPIWIAPAMNSVMYTQSIFKAVLQKLQAFGVHVLPPAEGLLACGTEGIGKLPDPEKIVEEVCRYFVPLSGPLLGKRCIVTGGSTISKIDPARIFTNRSTGKMANALADALKRKGAAVTYIGRQAPTVRVDAFVQVDTTEEMLEAVLSTGKTAEILVMCAAPLDYYADYHVEKIKKGGDLTLTFHRSPDILSTVRPHFPELFIFGFAAESTNHEASACEKMARKGMDMIFVNDISDADGAMGSDENEGVLLTRKGLRKTYAKMPKSELAYALVDDLEDALQ